MPVLPLVHWLVVISALIGILGSAAYIRDTVAGKTKPNRVTWSMWACAPLLGAAAAFSSGADHWVIVRIFLAGFLPLLVFLASFINPQSYWRITSFDLVCGAIALFALLVWTTLDSPRFAILLLAIADGFASIPTLIKAWNYPETETGITYITSLFTALLVIPSIPEWNIENAAFPAYLLIANSVLLFAVYRKRLAISSGYTIH